MKTNLNLILFLLFTYNCLIVSAQDNFYPATVTYKNGNTEQVFFKTKSKVVDENKVIIYKTGTYSSDVALGPNDFEKIESLDGQLVFVTKEVNGLEDGSKLILKQLLKGDASLYATQLKSSPRYVIQKGNEFYLMKSLTSQSGFLYTEWLYNNLNSNGLIPKDYNRISHNKSDLIDYIEKENLNSQILRGEKKVPFFNIGITAGVGLYNYKFSDNSINFNLANANSINYQVGVRGYFHLDPVQDIFSAFLDIKYSTVSNDQAQGEAFPLSDFSRGPIVHDFGFSMTHIEAGFQYNFHLYNSTISPFVKFGPAYFLNNSSSFFESEDSFISQESTLYPDTAFSFGLGVNYSHNNTFSLSLGYDTLGGARIFYPEERLDLSWSGFSTTIVYNFVK